MNASRNGAADNHFTPLQKRSLQRFQQKVAQKMPELRIAWAQPYNDTIIEMHVDYDQRTYRKGLKASKLAVEVKEETGVLIIFR